MKERIKNINYIKEKTLQGEKLYWIAANWSNDLFIEFIRTINCELKIGEIVYDERNLLARISSNTLKGIERDIIIKKFNLTRNYDKIRFRFINSKAIRSLRIALALKEIGVRTPEPIAVIEKRGRFNKILYSYYITEYIPYRHSLYEIVNSVNHPLRDMVSSLLPKIAKDIRKMHEHGVIHNDLHAGNILIEGIEKDAKFYYIDLNRARIKKKLSRKERMKDLARLKLNEAEQEIFLENYAPQKYKSWLELMREERIKREKFCRLKKRFKSLLGIK